MNRSEHLLSCLAEECDEVGQRCMKALRFGLEEVQAGQDLNNSARIVAEYIDLLAVFEMCVEAGLMAFAPAISMADLVDAKKAKVEKYMLLAIEKGALSSSQGRVE